MSRASTQNTAISQITSFIHSSNLYQGSSFLGYPLSLSLSSFPDSIYGAFCPGAGKLDKVGWSGPAGNRQFPHRARMPIPD
jgi:hypothetical protein